MKIYSLAEFKKEFKVSDRMWRDRREELFLHMQYYFDYTIEKKGRSYIITIKEVYHEWEPLGRKVYGDTVKKMQYYYEKTSEIVEEKPWNTAANIARNIQAKYGRGEYDHSEITMEGYVRPIIKNNFIVGTAETQWMYLSEDGLTYIPMTDDQLKFMYKNFEKNSDVNLKKKKLDIIGDIVAGNVDKEKGLEEILAIEKEPFFSLMQDVKAEFGFWPIRVKKLKESRFKNGEFEF